MGSALNDTCSAIWCLIIAAMKGKLGDFFRTLRTKPGIVMICAALVGGPIASTCYVIGLQQAGSLAVPISALCPAIGAILARVLFKQPADAAHVAWYWHLLFGELHDRQHESRRRCVARDGAWSHPCFWRSAGLGVGRLYCRLWHVDD